MALRADMMPFIAILYVTRERASIVFLIFLPSPHCVVMLTVVVLWLKLTLLLG